jgi:hypothetical protein
MTPIEQLTFDFARLVADYPEAEYAKDLTPGRFWKNHKSHTFIPDYPNDWNATIGAIEARGWLWVMSKGPETRFANVGDHPGYVFGDEKLTKLNEPPCTALMRAAVETAKSQEKT